MNCPFLKEETFGLRTQDTFIGNTCEIYLPSYFFDKTNDAALAAVIGDRIRTIGIFYFKVDGTLYNIQLPISYEFQFSEVEKRTFRIKPDIPEIEYQVYILKKGDAFVYDVLHKKSADDFKFFMNKLIENAKMPPYISYEDALPIYMNAMIASDTKGLGVDAVTIEFILSGLYRNKKQMRDPFRLAYNGHNEFDYKMVRINKIPQLTSTFTAISSEDIDTQLVSSILNTRDSSTNGEEVESPIEKIIKY